MRTDLERTSAPLPPLRGRPGLCQGAYGQCGNLELFAPDAEDGFWVFWFNSSTDDASEQGALPGEWSGGLHVHSGQKVDAVTVAQVPFGPGNLEIITLANGCARRWVWTETHGFLRGEELGPALQIGPVQVADAGRSLELNIIRPNGTAARLSSAINQYPHLCWHETPSAELLRDAAACESHMCGVWHTENVTVTNNQGIRHFRRREDGSTQNREIVSRVLWPRGCPVHRDAPDTLDLETVYPRT